MVTDIDGIGALCLQLIHIAINMHTYIHIYPEEWSSPYPPPPSLPPGESSPVPPPAAKKARVGAETASGGAQKSNVAEDDGERRRGGGATDMGAGGERAPVRVSAREASHGGEGGEGGLVTSTGAHESPGAAAKPRREVEEREGARKAVQVGRLLWIGVFVADRSNTRSMKRAGKQTAVYWSVWQTLYLFYVTSLVFI